LTLRANSGTFDPQRLLRPRVGYTPGMLARLFRLYALKRLFDMFMRRRAASRGRTRRY
jgi:hypothetical protein